MKTYLIYIDGKKTNTHIRGRISGMIYVLTGQPKMTFGWAKLRGDIHYMTKVVATEEELTTITDCIEKAYPDAILLVKEKE